MDLTPQATERSERRRRPWRAVVAVTLVLVALGAVVANGLGNATLYFHTVDEAVAEAGELGDRRFRLKGTVVDGTVEEADDAVRFQVADGGEQLLVVHRGDPPELFQPGIPVVLEGNLADDGARFESDRIMVKHSNEYEAENPERLTADDG